MTWNRGARRRRSLGGAALWLPLAAIACDHAAIDAPKPPGIERTEESILDAPLAPPRSGDAAAARALHQQGLAALQRDDVVEAARLFEAALVADPACLPALLDHGFLLLEGHGRGSFGAAVQQFRLARLVDPHDPMAACGEGIARRELGDLARAEALLREALAAPQVRAEPGRGTLAVAALAAIAASNGKRGEALEGYAKALAVAGLPPGTRANFLLSRGELLLEASDFSAAEAAVAEALTLDPEEPRAHLLAAQLATRDGDVDRAARERRRHELLRALKDHTSQRHRVDVERTLALRRELVVAWPEYLGGLERLARLLLDQAQFHEALERIRALAAAAAAPSVVLPLEARACAGLGDLPASKRAIDAIRWSSPAAKEQFLRVVLNDWQRAHPEVDDSAFAAQLAAWSGS